jgi:hypothetical protein
MFKGDTKYAESVTTSKGNQKNFQKEHGFLSNRLPHPEATQKTLK